MGYAAAGACTNDLTGLAVTSCSGGTLEDEFKQVATFMCGPC